MPSRAGSRRGQAPPFASLGEFSSALERFEQGDSRDVLRGVLQRGARSSRPIAALFAVPVAGDAACGRAFASGAATHRCSAAADTRSPQTGRVPERAATADRRRGADLQVLRRRRRSGLACALIAAVGRCRPRRHSSRRLRWASPSGTESRPACRDKAIRLRAGVARGRSPHLPLTIRRRTPRQ